jgi:spore maturation protein CgeB
MSARRIRALLVTRKGEPGLLGSYGRALEHLGVDTAYWDLDAALGRAVPLRQIGRRLNALLPVDVWQARASRDLVLAARKQDPDLLMVCGATRVTPGALAQLRASVPRARLVFVWPDSMLNLTRDVILGLPQYDLVSTYSEASVGPLRRLGATDVRWAPFAADPMLMSGDVSVSEQDRQRLSCDIAFIGNPRPERERALVALMDAGFHLRVWGSKNWVRTTADPARARRYWQGHEAVGADFARATRCARLNLNVIDDTNYPAANMRFFELFACGATQLASSCPEMQPMFADDSAVVYFDDEKELVAKARRLLGDDDARRRIAAEGQRRTLEGHTYAHRVRTLLADLALPLPETSGN